MARLPQRGGLLAALVLVTATALVPAALAEVSPDAATVWFNDDPNCSRPADAYRVDVSLQTGLDAAGPMDTPEHHLWIDNPPAQAAAARVTRTIRSNSAIVIGTFIDYQARELVVVVDPRAAVEPLMDELSSDVGSDLPVRVQKGCVTKSAIDSALLSIASGEWFESGVGFHALLAVDPPTGRIEVTIAGEHEDAAENLRLAINSDLVSVTTDLALHDRMNDGSPHYGGAAIGPRYDRGDTPLCTAGPMVDKDGGRWATTAAHCDYGNPSVYWYTGWGYRYFGMQTLVNHVGDSMLIGSGIDRYARILHVDPPTADTRLVSQKQDVPDIADAVCVSGMVTKAVCSVIVEMELQACYYEPGSGWCWPVFLATRTGALVSQGGDSGAPVYQRLSRDRARIMGMNVAGNEYPPYDTSVFTPTFMVEESLDATIATTCCTDTSW